MKKYIRNSILLFLSLITGCAYAQFPDFCIKAFNGLEYTSVPIGQDYPVKLNILVGNKGPVKGKNLNFQVTVRKGGTIVFQQTLLKDSLGPGAEVLLPVSTFRPSRFGTGDYRLELQGSFTGTDANPSDNQLALAKFISVSDSVFARDNGKVVDATGFSGETGSMGQLFSLYKHDTLSSVSFVLDNPTPGTEVSISIFGFSAGYPANKIISSPVFTIKGKGLNTYSFKPKVVLPAGYYVIALDQLGTKKLSLATSDSLYASNTAFYRSNNNMIWKTYGSSFPYTLMIRPNFIRDYVQVGISRAELDEISLNPNPFTDKLTVSLPEAMSSAQLTVHDLFGRLVISKEVGDANTEVDLSGEQAGIYFIRIKSGNRLYCGKALKYGN